MTAKDLKNALLQEAVQGKLVPQIASEGNARDLLEEIRKERLSHEFANSYGICDRKNKKSKSSDLCSKSQITVTKKELPEITEDEIPFDIPENWCWCRLIDVLKDKPSNGISPKEVKYETKIRSLSLSATTSGVFNSNAFKYVELDKDTASKYWLKTNDLLIQRSNSRELVGTSCIYYGDDNLFIYPDLMMRMQVQQNIKLEYIDYVLKSPHVRNYYSKNASGTSDSMPKINQTIVCNTLIPLPPLAEQKRIVAAIEKFMPLIEEYDKKETELKAFNEQIGTLTKKAILLEAVQGKLVPQIPAEGNAKDLLEEINKEKTKLIKEGKIKKEKPLPEISEDEIPFDIPESWCWCRLGEIIDTNIGLTYSPTDIVQSGGIAVLRSNNIQNGEIVYNDLVYVSKTVPEKCMAKKGDLLICARNGSRALVGKCAIIKENGMSFGAFMALIRSPFNSYIMNFINSPLYRARLEGVNTTTINQITQDNLKETLIPFPPLAEQKRIVAAIEKMLPLCEKLGGKEK